jgi:hypothetical protein
MPDNTQWVDKLIQSNHYITDALYSTMSIEKAAEWQLLTNLPVPRPVLDVCHEC